MTQSSLTPAGDASLVKGAAIAALVYRGFAFLAFGLFALVFSSLFFSLASLPADSRGYSPTDHLDELSIPLAVTLLIFLIILGIPVALSIWMFVAANRGRSGQVLAALILYSIPFGIALIAGIAVVVSYDYGSAPPDSSLSLVAGLLPEAAILIIGWLGWWRMRRPPALPAPGQPPYQMPLPGSHTAQQYPPPPYYGQPQPWQGQGPSWPGPGRAY